jgi:class 3 adenylate cyclase
VTGERAKRAYATVLLADIAGYSIMMGLDEQGTLDRFKKIRKDLFDPSIDHHNGRIVKTTGDGMLVKFETPIDAVCCAVEVQRGMPEQNSNVLQHLWIKFRIGIHFGDIVTDDNDIFGEVVNIAARLEANAEPGGILISHAVHELVHRRIDVAFEDEGAIPLKNIEHPMHVFSIAGLGDVKPVFLDWKLADWPTRYPKETPLLLSIRPNDPLPQVVIHENFSRRYGTLPKFRFQHSSEHFKLAPAIFALTEEASSKIFPKISRSQNLHDGRNVRLTAIDDNAADEIKLHVQVVNYFDYIRTNLVLDYLGQGQACTLRRYLHSNGTLQPLEKSSLADNFGINILIFTASGELIIHQS